MIKKKSNTLDKNLLSYFVFCAIAIFIYIISFNIKPDSAMFPKLLSIIIFSLNAFLIGQYFYYFFTKNEKEITQNRKNYWKSIFTLKKYTVVPILIFIICCLFVFTYPRIGFELSGFLLVFSIMILINGKEAIKKFYIAILIPLFFLLIFKVGLNLSIPLTMEIFFK